jgi:phenylacetate-CoA ligase
MNLRLKLIDLIGHTNIHAWYRFLQESQYWSIERQVSYQESKLKLLVEHAYHNVPYYQKLFTRLKLKPNDIRKISDLQKLPVISRKTLQNNYNELMARNHKDFKSQYRSTGGTTGEPVRYLSDLNTWSLHWALKFRAWETSNYKIGDKIAIVGGASVVPEKRSIKRQLWNLINNYEIFSSVKMTDESIGFFLNNLNKNNIKHIRGYPSPIFLMAAHSLKHNISLDIKSVITTAEVLQPYYKEVIQRAFKPIIIDSYGCADGGGNANTCEKDVGFHISFEASIWELCDQNGVWVKANELGEVTLTSLTNFAMPLLRYQPGDVVKNSFNNHPCSCGRTSPRIGSIIGKTTDILKFSNGRMLGGPSFPQLFRLFPLIKWQLVQNELNSLDVNIIPAKDFTPDHENTILELMKNHCGLNVKVSVNIVDKVDIPRSGKQRIIINNTLK